MSQLLPYITFNHDCKEAMEFYHQILGGDLEFTKFGEMNPDMPAEDKDKIMHAHLRNDKLSIMGADPVPGSETKFGDNIRICITGADEAEIKGYFDKLSEGGQIFMAFDDQPWGQKLGMLADKFGISWLLSTEKE